MSTAEHALLPPSSAHIWGTMGCHVWPLMNQTFPELVPGVPAVEGTAVHWGASSEIVDGREVQAGERAPNGIVLDEEMVQAVEVYSAAVSRVKGQELHVEETIRNDTIHKENWGTPDLWTFAFPYLDIFDFKYGHEFVDAYENWQGINYAALIFRKMGIESLPHLQGITVRITIVQPRAYTPLGSVRTWEVNAADLIPYFNKLRLGATESLRVNPIARPGVYCEHCPGRHACTILQRTVESISDRAYAVLPLELPPEAVGVELRSLMRAQKMLEARVTGLKAQAEGMLRAGTRVPHFMIETNPGREKWKVPVEQVIALGEAMGVKLAKPDVVTPNQARDMGLSKDLVAAMADRPSGAAKLVLDDGSKARRVFGN